MNKKDQAALEELQAYLASRDEKTNTQSDKKIIANTTSSKREIARKRTNEQFASKEARERHSKISKEKRNDPEILAKYKAAAQNPERNAKVSKAKIEQYKDENYKQSVRNSVKQAMARPEVKEKIAKGIELRKQNGWYEKNRQATQNPIVRAKRIASLKNQSKESIERRRNAVQKPIMTPAGIFASKKIADAHYLANGLVNAGKKISKYMIDDPTNWYYIPKEEYKLLTGKDL